MNPDYAYSIRCNKCTHWCVNRHDSKCNRFIYPDVIIPYRSVFSSIITGEHHYPCDQFAPSGWWHGSEKWTTWEDWYETMLHVDPVRVNRNVAIFVNGDDMTIYHVPAADFYHGWRIKDGLLLYADKITHKSRVNYRLIHHGPGEIKLNK